MFNPSLDLEVEASGQAIVADKEFGGISSASHARKRRFAHVCFFVSIEAFRPIR
jgi:hypothetical protein